MLFLANPLRKLSHDILTEFGRGQPGDALKAPVEVRQGIEADFEGHFTDARMWVL